MLIIIILGILFILGIVIYKLDYYLPFDIDYKSIGTFVSVFSGFIFIILILMFLIVNAKYINDIIKYETFIELLKNDKKTIKEACILEKISDYNEWLKTSQYWNTKFFIQDFIPDKINDLKPIG